ncbi:MAG: outer membrane beta-barrel protein [Lentisphaeria bacterium]|nr:outer membrane beta-barrel protein [Lentisphaeria bacterium]
MNNAKKMIMITAAALAVSTGAFAADQEGWKFELTPYAWLVGIEGDITVNGTKVDFDKSFSDLFDTVELGGSFRFGAEYDRFLVGALVDYFSLSTDELDVEDRPQGGSLDTDMLLTEVAIGYRVDGWAEGQSFGLMVGVRNMHLENELKVNGVGTFSRDNDVTDAMFYVLPSIPVFPSKIDGLRFNPVLGIGAGDSELAYELFPQFQYNITENVAVRLGYRTVGWKFKGDNNDDNELNVRLSGLIVGLGVTF